MRAIVRSSFRLLAAPLTMGLMVAGPAQAQDEEAVGEASKESAIKAIFGDLVGGEWRTPNPDFGKDEYQAKEYVLRYKWGPYRQHVIGELLGTFESDEGEKQILFWTIYAIHNVQTGQTSALQINWDGSLGDGTLSRGEDGRIIADQTFYWANGKTERIRHVDTVDPSGKTYTSETFEMNADGQWQEKNKWTWTRQDGNKEE